MPAPLRLRLDGVALPDNWRALAAKSRPAAGGRDFFVATWAEAEALAPSGAPLAVLHGVRDEDMAIALSGIARPVLNTAGQLARWKAAGGGACDVMVDTGKHRLGVSPGEIAAGLLDGLSVD